MIEVKVPASTANLGSGFDVLGLALSLYNIVQIEENDEFLIEVEGEGKDEIFIDERNLVYRSLKFLFDKVGHHPSGLFIKIINQIPIARGLGSSAAAIVGSLLAGNQLLGNPFLNHQLISFAIELEGHPDNVCASFSGGLTISFKVNEAWSHSSFKLPSHIKVLIVVPPYRLATSKAREVLPQTVSLKDVVFNLSRISLLIASLFSGKDEFLKLGMEDRIHQPYRAKLIPGMEEIISGFQAIDGILGVALSGAGPAITSLYLRDREEKVLEKANIFLKGLSGDYFLLPLEVDNQGAQIIQK